MSKLWEPGSESPGKKDTGQDMLRKKVESFTVGNDYVLDQILLPYDLDGSAVHVKALGEAGYLSAEELKTLLNGLEEIRSVWEKGEFEILPEHEDGHTAIEVWLTEKLGELGKKIHTGRSRNDQVLTAVRLYEKSQLQQIKEHIDRCAESILTLAENNKIVPMPGYTHTRKAMISGVAQWLAGYAELLLIQRDASTGVMSMVDRSPLGTAAGFGTSIDLNRQRESDLLGFSSPIVSATSAQLSRGWVELQLVQYLSGITVLLSRFASDVIRFSSESYGFIDIDEVLCTGSSIMPNKKNPDVAELIRGKNALMDGYATTLKTVMTNLGSGYHRDLQLTKEPVIRAFETASDLLEMSTHLVDGLSFNKAQLKKACSSDLFAAEEAYRMVKEEGLSFREAYHKVKAGIKDSSEVAKGKARDPEQILSGYTQLGSPGNPGLDRLLEWLRS